MSTGSSASTTQIVGPLYLDSSAVVKLYFPETESETLNQVLQSRRDVLISDLAVTEIVSSLSRRRRENDLAPDVVTRLHVALLEHVEQGLYRRIELLPAVHRDAERLLQLLDAVPLRAADALHLALAMSGGAGALITYDRRLAEAARATGLRTYP